MDAKRLARYQARAKIVKAMAHPTRLFLVEELARNGERCVLSFFECVESVMQCNVKERRRMLVS